DGEALLEFLVTPERLVTFVVRRDGVRSLESSVTADDLLNRVRLARDLIARGGDAGPREAVLGALHGILVAPAERAGLLRGARTLIVVPHSGLAYLPIAALFDTARRRYLVESYAVSTMPSAAAFVDGRGQASTSSESAVVLAPVPEELPGTKSEAIAVARATTAPAPLVGASATEAALRRALGRGGIVHVATHGV